QVKQAIQGLGFNTLFGKIEKNRAKLPVQFVEALWITGEQVRQVFLLHALTVLLEGLPRYAIRFGIVH
ncbi:hypothetical protein, partial [Halopseudomonas sp.]|uniref:hypothetical protein n=1 Tax=Halopseudomonas sp. TaxID=2901191 RepID=UPI003003935F